MACTIHDGKLVLISKHLNVMTYMRNCHVVMNMASKSDFSLTGANSVTMFVNREAALDKPEVYSNFVTTK
jgi:hypothetical protein